MSSSSSSSSSSAAAAVEDVKFSLKVMMNEQNTKVLFAEAGSDFADVLISFLTTPLGSIVRILNKHYGGGDKAPLIGSVTTLYNGLANLDTDHFWTQYCKHIILNPRTSFEAECCRLKLDVNESKPPQYFYCKSSYCDKKTYCNTSVYHVCAKCICGKPMTILRKEHSSSGDAGVFTLNETSFIVSDDLRIFPNMTGFLQALVKLGIADTEVGCSRDVTFGFNEVG